MRNYIYKVIIFVVAIVIIFEFTVGKHLDNFNQKINYFSTKEGRKDMVASIKKRLEKLMKKRTT